MKVVIIEGMDNTGKNTLISGIINWFNIVKIIHCDKPTSENPIREQENLFTKLAISNLKDNSHKDIDCIIYNRAWYGENVYGVLYRGNTEDNVEHMCIGIENILRSGIWEEDICYLQLMSNIDLVISNDDGLSISKNDKEKIENEKELFLSIYNKSSLKNKHIINVNDKNGNFRSKEDILNEAKKYIFSNK